MTDDTQHRVPSSASRTNDVGGEGGIVRGGGGGSEAPPLPTLTGEQVRWLAVRMMAHSDLEACVQMEREERGGTVEWLDRVEAWKADGAFLMGYQWCLADPKEGTKWLATALLPSIIPALMDAIATPRTRSKGIELLLKMHGMFIDKIEATTREDIRVLVADLRRPTVLTPMALPNGGRAHVVKDAEDDV